MYWSRRITIVVSGAKMPYSHRKVLVVDDNPMFTDATASVLDSIGYKVIRCYGGRDGLEKAEEHIPDLIIADYEMQDLDGLSLLQALRRAASTSHIPFIAVTGHATSALREQFHAAGAAGFHSKFEVSTALLDTMEKLLSSMEGPLPEEEE
jgi:CheY-like chemotaxis protein